MTMREKIARALFTQNESGDIAWDTCPQEIRDEHFASADAALAALEEPTEAMIEAGYAALTDNKTDPADIFRAMIRAAGE